jgi:hypothetical protein
MTEQSRDKKREKIKDRFLKEKLLREKIDKFR